MHLSAFCIIGRLRFYKESSELTRSIPLTCEECWVPNPLRLTYKIPANALKSFNLFLGIVITCKFEQTQNFLNDSSLSPGHSKYSAAMAGGKLRVPPSVLKAWPERNQRQAQFRARPLVAWLPLFPWKRSPWQCECLNVPPAHPVPTAGCSPPPRTGIITTAVI